MRDLLLQPLLLLHRIKGFFHSSFQGFFPTPALFAFCYFNMASQLKVEIDRKISAFEKILILWIKQI